MAAELRSVLLYVSDDPLFQLGSCEMEGAKDPARKITEASSERSKSEDFETFATSLVNSLKRALTVPGNIKCYTTRREKVWRSFHHKEEIELPLRWGSFGFKIWAYQTRLQESCSLLNMFFEHEDHKKG